MPMRSPKPFLFTRCKAYIGLKDFMHMLDKIEQDPAQSIELRYFALPFSYLEPVAARFSKNENFVFGSESMANAKQGSFTESIASVMLKKAGARFALLGTSERRALFRETDKSISEKVHKCLQDGIEPIVCFGETLEQYKAGKSKDVIQHQLTGSLAGLTPEQISKLSLIYEAPWMYSLPIKPTGEQVLAAQKLCNGALTDLLGADLAGSLQVVQSIPTDIENVESLTEKAAHNGVFVSLNMIPSAHLNLSLFIPKKMEIEQEALQPEIQEEEIPEANQAPAPPPAPVKTESQAEEEEAPEEIHEVKQEQVHTQLEEKTEAIFRQTTVISEGGAGIQPQLTEEDVEEEEEGEFYAEEDEEK